MESVAKIRSRLVYSAPRLYYILTYVVFPLFFLIGVCHLFGSIIAELESTEEVKQNNAILMDAFLNKDKLNTSSYLIRYSAVDCLNKFNNNTGYEIINLDELRESLSKCGENYLNDFNQQPFEVLFDDLNDVFATSALDVVTFGWTVCSYKGKYNYDNSYVESDLSYFVNRQWLESFEKQQKEFEQLGMDKTQAYDLSLQNASGFNDCKPNYTGGALFFFTIMTTIGYGNFTATTTGSRLVVFIVGFFAILMFMAISGNAGSICLTIFDDFAQKRSLTFLKDGAGAAAFWFVVLWLWITIFAALAITFNKHDVPNDSNFGDSIWFSYITMTTVGLGDISFAQDDFKDADLLLIPFMTLVGFVLLANFLIKASGWLLSIAPLPPNIGLSELLKSIDSPQLKTKQKNNANESRDEQL